MLPGKLVRLMAGCRRPAFEWLVWIAIVILALRQTRNFDRDIEQYAFGADGWPTAILTAILAGATLQLAFRLRQKWRFLNGEADSVEQAPVPAETPQSRPEGRNAAGWLNIRLICIFLLPFLYLFLMPRLGFYVTTPCFIPALLLLLQVRSLRALVLVTLSVYGVALLIFTRLFYVALPIGRLDPFYDINVAILVFVRAGL